MQPDVLRQLRMHAIGVIGFVLALLAGWLLIQRWAAEQRAPAPSAEDVEVPPMVTALEQRELAPDTSASPPHRTSEPGDRQLARARLQMVDTQLRGRDITDQRVLDAMRRVPRHRFVDDEYRQLAYADHPIPIGHGQTISQPYIVALMTQLAQIQPDARALDVGTGSGYQAAVLAELVDKVYSIEIVCPLADHARDRLDALGYENIEVRCGDGYGGWPEQAPFDVIIVAAAPKHIPKPLVDQLAPLGRLVIPIGAWFQDLTVVEKQPDGSIRTSTVAPVAFVPMTGEARDKKDHP